MPVLATDEQNRLKQIHDYIRHIFQLSLGWFAFFAGINYVALGWLATSPGVANHRSFVFAVGVNIIIQNLLRYSSPGHSKNLASKASELEGPDGSVPTALYRSSVVSIGIALFVTVWAIVIATLWSLPAPTDTPS